MITLKTAGPGDALLLQKLADSIWRLHFPGIISDAQIDYMLGEMYDPGVIIDELGRGIIWKIAYSQGVPAGYCSYGILKNDLDNGNDADKEFCKLFKLYVHPDRQRQGIGRLFLEKTKEYCRANSISRLRLNVHRDNQKALKAYETYGFKKIREENIRFGGFMLNDYVLELVL